MSTSNMDNACSSDYFQYNDNKIKISFLGYSGAGKTSLINNYLYGEFKYNVNSTIGLIHQIQNIFLNDQNIQILISDTSGQEKFNSIPRSYYRNNDAFVIVYDITDQLSFNALKFWIDDVCKYGNENPFIFIVGNKIDIANEFRVISYDKMTKFIKDLNIKNIMPYTEVSAKSGLNVQTFMKMVVNTCVVNKKFVKQDNLIPAQNHENINCCNL